MERRRLLALLGAGVCSVPGCLGPDMPQDAVARAVPASKPRSVTAVRFRALPESERAIAEAAVEDEFYHACPELPDAVREFAGRFGNHDEAYLEYERTTYGLWIRITDLLWASTASPPDTDPSCGGLF